MKLSGYMEMHVIVFSPLSLSLSLSLSPHLKSQFFERLELFAYESVRKQEELTERIKREVCEPLINFGPLYM